MMFGWIRRYIALERQNAAQTATIEWMRVRVNQLERENAMLKNQKFHLPVDAVEIVQAEAPLEAQSGRVGVSDADPRPTIADLTSGNISMEDMGDEEARRQGVEWDGVGQVTYR